MAQLTCNWSVNHYFPKSTPIISVSGVGNDQYVCLRLFEGIAPVCNLLAFKCAVTSNFICREYDRVPPRDMCSSTSSASHGQLYITIRETQEDLAFASPPKIMITNISKFEGRVSWFTYVSCHTCNILLHWSLSRTISNWSCDQLCNFPIPFPVGSAINSIWTLKQK